MVLLYLAKLWMQRFKGCADACRIVVNRQKNLIEFFSKGIT